MLGVRVRASATRVEGSAVSLRSARISLGAIGRNARTVTAASGGPIWADVSADAHGHGALAVAAAAVDAGVQGLLVATAAEGAALRRAGITAPIVAWQHAPGEGFERAAAFDVVPAVSTLAQLAAASAAVPAVVLAAAVGGGVIGCPAADWHDLLADAALRAPAGGPRVDGLLVLPPRRTPCSRQDRRAIDADVGDAADLLAEARAAGLTVGLGNALGAAPEASSGRDRLLFGGSASALAGPHPLGVPVIGRALYGLSPFTEEDAADLGLVPAMTVRAQVVTTKTVGAGEGISYGYTYRTRARSTLALVAIGYAHGIDRAASNRCTVCLNGRSYPVAGRVAMDVFVVDLGDDTVSVGDEAVLFGDPADGHPSVETWARALGSSPDRVVTAIAPQVVRSYV